MASTKTTKAAKAPAKPKPKAQAKPKAPAQEQPPAPSDNVRHGIAATLLSGLTFTPSTLEEVFKRCGFDPSKHGKYAVANARKALLALIRAGKAERTGKGLYSLPAALVGPASTPVEK